MKAGSSSSHAVTNFAFSQQKEDQNQLNLMNFQQTNQSLPTQQSPQSPNLQVQSYQKSNYPPEFINYSEG